MMEIDTSYLSDAATYILNKLLEGGPNSIDQANDWLWILAGELNQKVALIKKLETLVNHKQLTGLLNDRGFNEEIAKEQNRVNRRQSNGGVIVSLDLAGFKRINDRYNTQIGDQALQLFAEIMKEFGFRDTDILGNPGGDEFIVVITDTELIMPETIVAGTKVFHDFNKTNSSLWKKIDEFSRLTQAIPFEFEYKGEIVTETIHARIAVTEYNKKTSLKQALARADEIANGALKAMTKQYIPGGR